MPRESLLAQKMRDVVHTEDREDLELSIHRLFSGELRDFVTEKRFIRHDGETIWVKLTVSLARVAQTHGAHGVAVIEDITEQKHGARTLPREPFQSPRKALYARARRSPKTTCASTVSMVRYSANHGKMAVKPWKLAE